jgi:hypothetical protein
MTGPRYRGLRLDGPMQEFHLAVDRLRWDTVPATVNYQQPASPPRPHRRRQDPSDGQAALLKEPSCTSPCT